MTRFFPWYFSDC